MAVRDPYDGKPYYCTNCGEAYDNNCKDDCVVEPASAALDRQRKRRATTSDLDAITKAQRD